MTRHSRPGEQQKEGLQCRHELGTFEDEEEEHCGQRMERVGQADRARAPVGTLAGQAAPAETLVGHLGGELQCRCANRRDTKHRRDWV